MLNLYVRFDQNCWRLQVGKGMGFGFGNTKNKHFEVNQRTLCRYHILIETQWMLSHNLRKFFEHRT